MEELSVVNSRRGSVISVREGSPTHSDERLEGSRKNSPREVRDESVHYEGPPRQRTPAAAIIDFDGNVQQVRAHKLINRYVTKPCLAFCIHTIALAACMILGIVMMMLTPYSSPEFTWWASLFNLGLGGFLPQPKLGKNR